MQRNIDVKKYNDIEQLKTLMANAKRLGNMDVSNACFRRICEINGIDVSDPLGRRMAEVLAGVELCLLAEHDKIVKASYTRRKLQNKGVHKTLYDWAMARKETKGFRLLVANGMADLTGEYVVVEFADQFPPEAVEAARARLEQHGIPLPN